MCQWPLSLLPSALLYLALVTAAAAVVVVVVVVVVWVGQMQWWQVKARRRHLTP